MSWHGWHHCGPCWDSYRYSRARELEIYPPRRRCHMTDVADDLRDYLQYLEEEVAAVRREVDELTVRKENPE